MCDLSALWLFVVLHLKARCLWDLSLEYEGISVKMSFYFVLQFLCYDFIFCSSLTFFASFFVMLQVFVQVTVCESAAVLLLVHICRLLHSLCAYVD